MKPEHEYSLFARLVMTVGPAWIIVGLLAIGCAICSGWTTLIAHSIGGR